MKISSINRQTGIPIRELNRLNSDRWFHGTSLQGAKSLQDLGVIASYNIGNMLDFGAGFYLTYSKEKADSYISRVPVITKDYAVTQRTTWAVIEYSFNPYKLLFGDPQNDQDGINIYQFKNFPHHDDEFARFVFFNRLYNSHNETPHKIDVIWGVMSDNRPDQIVQDYQNGKIAYAAAIEKFKKSNSMRQLYIGNQAICDMLKLEQIYEHK